MKLVWFLKATRLSVDYSRTDNRPVLPFFFHQTYHSTAYRPRLPSLRHGSIFYRTDYQCLNYGIDILSFPGGDDLHFSLKTKTYQNNSLVSLEEIGEGEDALWCTTDLTTCCKPPHTETALGNWFYPNETRVPNSKDQWNFYRERKRMVVNLNRRRGGEDGIYYCEIPDSVNVNQTIYIGVYNTSSGEGHFLYTFVLCSNWSGGDKTRSKL